MEFSGSGSEGISAKRESALKEVAAAHDAFKELQNNLSEGTKFYNDLTQVCILFYVDLPYRQLAGRGKGREAEQANTAILVA